VHDNGIESTTVVSGVPRCFCFRYNLLNSSTCVANEIETLEQVGFPSAANGFPSQDLRFANCRLGYERF
jgi:hypothetical protein